MRSFPLFLFSILTCSLFAQRPFINSFSPASGYVGSQVSIAGSNFNPNASGNIVFFGAVRATIVSATPTALTVLVPVGATYQPISVTTNGLTGYSALPFLVTFPYGNTLANSSFSPYVDSSAELHPNDIAVADFDGDGKADFATANSFSISGLPASVSVFRNASTAAGSIALAPRINMATGAFTFAVAAGDLNGDGKPDLVSGSLTDQSISVFQNTGSPGNISFAPKIDYPTNSTPYAIAIGDIDGDGLPDLAVANNTAQTITVYRNTSTGGIISFAPKAEFYTTSGPKGVVIADLDGDAKPDIAATNESNSSVSVFRNTSVAGLISFAAKTDFSCGGSPYGISAGDLNDDGKAELVIANYLSSGTTSILRNLSLPGTLSFAARVSIPTGQDTYKPSIADLNGDGKPDISVASNYIYLLQNTGSGGSIAFSSLPLYNIKTANTVALTDLDNDGKYDLAASIFTGESVLLYRNKNNEPVISGISPNPASAGTTVTITGKNFTGVTSVAFGGVPAQSFSVVSSTSITAIVGAAGTSGELTVTSPYGTYQYRAFIFAVPPTVSGFTPVAAGLGDTVTITGRNFANASSVTLGGLAASSYTVDYPSFLNIKAVVGNGATGKIKVITPYGSDSLAGFTYLLKPTISSFTPTQAGPGNTVTITGTNFTGATAVRFGGISARSFIVSSPTTITAVVDTGASGSVSVITPDGTFAKAGFTFIPRPIITSFTPTVGFSGTVLTINGFNFTNISLLKVGNADYTYDFTTISPNQLKLTLTNAGATGDIVIANYWNGSDTAHGFLFNPVPVVAAFSPLEAGPGMTVTITGFYFNNTTSVNFGGVPASSFIINSPNSISAVVGSSGASGYVSVTNAYGTTNNNYYRFRFSNRPVIQSVAPDAGPTGTIVTIKGGNFGNNTSPPVVMFGCVRSNIISITDSSLKVAVPVGATYGCITITNANKYTTTSNQPFRTLFTGGSLPFNAATFSGKIDFRDNKRKFGNTLADVDGDGKPDVISYGFDTISIYRNVSSNGTINFAPRVDLDLTSAYPIYGYTLGDLDGDTKPDLVFTRSNNTGVVYKNTSTPGNISFLPATTFSTNYGPTRIVIGDLNNDGKPEIALDHYGESNVAIYKNLTPAGGNISFANKQNFSSQGSNSSNIGSTDMVLADLNGDGYKDIVLGSDYSTRYYLVLENYAPTTGDLAFGRQIGEDLSINSFLTVATDDFNKDNKPDLIFTNYVCRNLGNLSFANVGAPGFGDNISIGDLDGDGKPDIAKAKGATTQVSAVRNITSATDISFEAPANYEAGRKVSTAVGDLDGDGKPEIVFCGNSDSTFSVLKNLIGNNQLCSGGSAILASEISGSIYQWQVNTGTGFTNISNNSNYDGVNTNNLKLQDIPSTWRNYQYRCIVNGSGISNVYTIGFVNTWTGNVSNNWSNPGNWSCGIVPDANTDVYINGGSIVVSSNAIVNSVHLSANASLTITTGFNLTILH